MKRWQQAGKKDAAALREEGIAFAATIMSRWSENPYAGGPGRTVEPCALFPALVALDEPRLIGSYLREVLTRDASVDPGKSLAAVCRKHGWGAFRRELEAAFTSTTSQALERNVRLLEHLCLAESKDEERAELCRALAGGLVTALERIDQEAAVHDWRYKIVDRAAVLAGLARSLLATEQGELLARLVAGALAGPEKYPLTAAHMSALTALKGWLEENVKRPCPALSYWLTACREQLQALTAREPQPPTDFRRAAGISCKCADCAELSRFLDDPQEQVHRFRAAEARRRHLESMIRHCHCDLDHTTERRGSPHTLVCTKNSASYHAKLRKFHQDQEHLATIRSIEQNVPT